MNAPEMTFKPQVLPAVEMAGAHTGEYFKARIRERHERERAVVE